MSAQINLYHPRFLKQRDWLTLSNVVAAAAALNVLLAGVGGWAWRDAAARQAEAVALEAQLKSVKTQVEAATQAAAARKPNVQLLAEVATAEARLHRREEIIHLLKDGVMGDTAGFADYLRGFARATPDGLWLTGFSIGAGGSEMEIRGSMLNAAALPEYIRRLGGEKVFQGRSFASLVMNRPELLTAVAPPIAVGAAAVPPSPTVLPRAIDFVLMPTPAETTETRPVAQEMNGVKP